MINAFLIAAIASAPLPESKPREPRPLPNDRSRVCERECYLLREGCEGRCGLRVEEERRDVVLLAHVEDIPDERARTEAARAAAAATKRLADTPTKTLRRRARGGDEEAVAELARRDREAAAAIEAERPPESR